MHPFYFEQARDLLARAQHILVLTDTRIDGDTIGSSLAFADLCRRRGLRVTHVAQDLVPAGLAFLPGFEWITTEKQVLADHTIDLVAVFDCSRKEVVEAFLGPLRERVPLLVFDHHASNTGFGDFNILHLDASSTCEVVYDFFVFMQEGLTPDVAKCLLSGMVTDTGVFSNPLAHAAAFEKAARLMYLGGSVKRVVDEVQLRTGVNRLRLWGLVFSRIVHHRTLGIATTYVLHDDLARTETTEEDFAELADYLGNALDVSVVFLLKELPGREQIKVSYRSRGHDLLPLAQAFGGGGHKTAGGFTVAGQMTEEGQFGRVVKAGVLS